MKIVSVLRYGFALNCQGFWSLSTWWLFVRLIIRFFLPSRPRSKIYLCCSWPIKNCLSVCWVGCMRKSYGFLALTSVFLCEGLRESISTEARLSLPAMALLCWQCEPSSNGWCQSLPEPCSVEHRSPSISHSSSEPNVEILNTQNSNENIKLEAYQDEILKNGSFGMLFVVSLSQGKPWVMNVCVTYMLLLPCCWQKFFEYCFGVVLLIFIPKAFVQENKFSHLFMPWKYGMHNFFCYKILFWMYLCNSKQMHLQIYTREHRLLKEGSQLWLWERFDIFTLQMIAMCKTLAERVQWQGLWQVIGGVRKYISDYSSFQL